MKWMHCAWRASFRKVICHPVWAAMLVAVFFSAPAVLAHLHEAPLRPDLDIVYAFLYLAAEIDLLSRQ